MAELAIGRTVWRGRATHDSTYEGWLDWKD